MKYLCIPLKGKRGGIALISEDAWPLIDNYNWYQTKNGYAISPKIGLMHRRMMAAENGEVVDHKNCNRLDNRYENIRCCLQSENNKRQSKRKTQWPYKGVRYSYGKWTARATINVRSIHLGSFNTPREAALAFDKFAKEHGRITNLGENK